MKLTGKCKEESVKMANKIYNEGEIDYDKNY